MASQKPGKSNVTPGKTYAPFYAANPVKGVDRKPEGQRISGADVPSEGLTPRRVYSENNGGNYRQCVCKTCGNSYRKPEPRGTKPGSMAVKVTDAQGKVRWFLPLEAEYMYHNRKQGPASGRELSPVGRPALWILPENSRKAIEVQGPCQRVTLAKTREDSGDCHKCYAEKMREIARGERKYNHDAAIIVRKHGDAGNIRVVKKSIDAETHSLAAISVAKRSGGKPRKRVAVKNITPSTQFAEPRLFGAYLVRNGVSVKGYAEARTIHEARKELAVSLGVDLADMAGRNIYVVNRPDRGLTTEEWKRVA